MTIPVVTHYPEQPDLTIPFVDALLSNDAITEELPNYGETVAVFSRRPVPADAPYPLIVISTDLTKQNLDGVDDLRPRITRDIAVYARNDTSAHYRTAERLARFIFTQFHNVREALVPPDGWMIADITANGPIPAPVDDDKFIGRVVSINVMLAAQR